MKTISAESLLSRLDGVKKTANGWDSRCPCPGHGKGKGDKRQSLSVHEDGEGVVFNCHAGCSFNEICAALGLDLEREPELAPPGNPQWVYRNRNGTVVGAVYRTDLVDGKKYHQASLQNGEWVNKAMLRPRPLYQLPRLLRADGPVVVVEGEKCVDALWRIGVLATTSSGGASSSAGTDWTPLRGREVVIVPDNDPPGLKYARAVFATLRPHARVVELPPGLPVGWDVADREWTREEFAELIAPPPEVVVPPGRKPSVDTWNPAECIDQCIASLGNRDVFVQGGKLVRPGDGCEMQEMTKYSLVDELSRCVEFTENMDAVRRAPDDVYEAILKRPRWPGVRRLEGVSQIPLLREDGSVHDAPGYDEATGYWFGGKKIAIGTTRCDASEAVEKLRAVTQNTLFLTEQDQLSWIAHVITHAVRPLIHGHVPAWVYSANYPGSGKTALAQAAAWVATGVETPPAQVKINTDEWTKTLFAAADAPALLIDNLKVTIANGELEGAITSGALTARRFHAQHQITRSWKPIVALTSNDGAVGPDMARRIMPVRLEKRDITHQYKGSLLDGVDRYEMASAALTIVRAYVMNGEVEPVTPWTSFDAWGAMVAAPLAWLGLGDLCAWRTEGIVEMAVYSDETAELHAAILDWMGERSFSPKDLCDMADGAELRRVQALVRKHSDGDGPLTADRVGRVLTSHQLSEYGFLTKTRTNKGAFWRLVPSKSDG